MSEKIISINDIITKERQAKGLVSTTEIANMLNTSNKVILENAKKLFPNKQFENGKTTFFNEKEITILLDKLQNNNSNQYDLNRSSKGINTTSTNDLIITKQYNNFNQLSIQDKIKFSFQCQADIIKELNENKELKDWKTEKLYIENEKYKSDELRTKINRVIRQKAQDFYNNNYKDCWNYYFKLYSDLHCFKGTQNIEMIQDRGHLKEFYNLILNK